MRNRMKVEFEALPENEGFARVAVASFITPVNPTVEEIFGHQNGGFRGGHKCGNPRL